MSKHSKSFEKKKAELERIEKELKMAIENESSGLEARLVQILKGAAAVSVAFLIGYGLYRWLKGDRIESDQETVNARKEPGFVDKVLDRVTDVVAGIAIQNLSKYIHTLKSELEKEIKR